MQMKKVGSFGGFVYREVIYKSKETLEALRICFEHEGWAGLISQWDETKFVLTLWKKTHDDQMQIEKELVF